MCIWYRSYECTADKEYKWKCSSQLWSNLSSYKIIKPRKKSETQLETPVGVSEFLLGFNVRILSTLKTKPSAQWVLYCSSWYSSLYYNTSLFQHTHTVCYLQHKDNNLSPCKILEKSINQTILPFHESWQDQDLNNILTHSCCFCLWYGASHKVQDSLIRKEQPMNNRTKMKTKLLNGNIEQAAPWKGGR